MLHPITRRAQLPSQYAGRWGLAFITAHHQRAIRLVHLFFTLELSHSDAAAPWTTDVWAAGITRVDHLILPDQRKQHLSAVSLHAFISIFSVFILPDSLPSSTFPCFPPFIGLQPSFSRLQLLNPHFFCNPISCRNRLSTFFLFIQFIFFFPQAFSLPAASNLSDLLLLLLPSFFSPPLYSLCCSSLSRPPLLVSVYWCCQLWCGAKKQLREIKLCLNQNCRSTLQTISRRLRFLISMNAP